MKFWMPFFLIFVSVSSLILELEARGRPAPSPSGELYFVVDPSTVTAGRTLSVSFYSSAPVTRARVIYGSRSAIFYSQTPHEWRALLGTHSLEEPGPREMGVEVVGEKGEVRTSRVPFVIVGGTYPISRLSLSAQKDSLLSSGAVDRDAAQLAKVYEKLGALQKFWSGPFVLPSTGIVSSVYGARRAYGQRLSRSPHSGMDIANKEGTPVRAPQRGQVVFSDWLESFGHCVILDHGQGVYSYYLHMKQRVAKVGEKLSQGQDIGLMGQEGLATGPHVHWSMVVAGERVDPQEWVDRDIP